MQDGFDRVVAAIGFLASLAIVAYVVVFRSGDAVTVALGALISVVSAGVGFYLRGKVQSPGQGEVTISAAPPAVASVSTAKPERPAAPPPVGGERA